MNYAAESLLIDEVMDPTSGLLLDAKKLIGSDYAALLRLRSELEEGRVAGDPKYVCPVCAAPLVLRCVKRREDEDFHFWHGTGRNACPLSQESRLSRAAILAAKYHGQREGAAHQRVKDLISDSLLCDPRFSDVEQERRWQHQGDPRQWRRPDISASFNGMRFAFEIQLSTTFVSVMAERRLFYKEQGAMLIWIMATFDPSWARLPEKDIFYPNNRNIFVGNDATLAESRRRGAMVLLACWSEPYDAGKSSPAFQSREQLVEFGDLTLDRERQRAYFFDTDGEEERLKNLLVNAPLRAAFERYWFAYLENGSDPDLVPVWLDLRDRFRGKGVSLPEHPSEVEPLLNSIYSARDAHVGRLVGWRFADLAKLAHHLFDKHKPLLWPFRLALKAFHREEMIRSHDPHRKWRAKVPIYTAAIAAGDPAYRSPSYALGLLAILFPSMAASLAQRVR